MKKWQWLYRSILGLVLVCAVMTPILMNPQAAFAANDRYWVGDDGSWTNTAKWSTSSGGAGGASVPTTTNDVHFDANSCADGFFKVTLGSGTMNCALLDFSGLDDTMQFYDGSGSTASTLNVYGSLTSSALLTWDNFSTRNEWLVFKTNGSSFTGAVNPTWSSSGMGVEIQATVTQVGNAYVNDFKFTSGSYTLANILYVGRAFTGGGQTYGGEVQMIGTGTASVCPMTGINTFNDLTINTTGRNNYVTLGGNQTVTGTFTAVGANSRNCQTIMSDGGTQRTITAATVVTDHTNWAYIIGDGAGDWDLAAEDSMEISDTTSGITMTYDRSVTATADMYWYGNSDGVPGGSGSWSVDDFSISLMYNWSTTSGDIGGSGRMPRPSTTNFVYFDANSGFTGGNATVSWALASDGGYTYCGGMDWTGADTSTGPIFSNGSGNYYPNFGVYGDVIFCPGLTFYDWNQDGFVLLGTGSHVYETNNAYTDIALMINCGTGNTYTADGDIRGIKRFVNTSGTFDTITNSSIFYIASDQNYPSFDGRLGQDYYYISWTPDNSAVRQFSFLSSCLIRNFYVQGNAQYDHQVKLGADMYFTNFSIHGFSGIYRLEYKSTVAGTQRQTSISGTVDVTYCDISNSAKVGAGNPDISAGLNSDYGGNLGWIFTPGIYVYWVGNSGSWSDLTNHWSVSSGGSPGSGRIPLIQDMAIFDANSFAIPGRTVTIDITDLSGIDASVVTNTPTFSKAGSVDIYGDVLLGSVTWTITSTYFKGMDSGLVSSSSLNTNMYVTKNSTYMSSLLLGSNLDVNGTVYVQSGIFNHNGWDLTAYVYDSGTTTTYARAIRLGSGVTTLDGTAAGNKWYVVATNLSFYCETSTIILTNSGTNGQTFAGASQTYNNVTQAGAGVWTMTVSGTNNVYQLKIDRSQASKTISGAVTITMQSFDISIVGVNTITITNTDFTMAVGVVLGDYLIISGSAAGGGATFFANTGGHSTNSGGNAGWIWTPPDPPTVGTIAATDVTVAGATLNGEILDAGSYISFKCYFQYGATIAYGYETTDFDTLTGVGTFDDRVSPFHLYHYRAVVEFGYNDHAYGNDMVISLVGGVKQAKAAVSDPGALPGDVLVSAAPDAIPNMYDESGSGPPPLAPLLDPALSGADLPNAAFWFPIAFLIAIALGFVAYGFTRNLIIQAIVSGVVMAGFCGGGVLGTGVLPYLTVVVFALEAVLIIIIQEKQHV